MPHQTKTLNFLKGIAMSKDCWFCRQDPKCRCVYDDGKPKKRIILPEDNEILTIEYVSALALAFVRLGLSREKFIGWLTDQLYNEKYEFYYSDGNKFPILMCTVYKAFNYDSSFRWLSDFDKFAYRPLLQKPHKTHLPRLQLITLGFMAARPDLVESIADLDSVPLPKGSGIIFWIKFTKPFWHLRFDYHQES